MTKEEFWDDLDRILSRKKMNYTDLSELSGISRNTIYTWKKNLRIPKSEDLWKIEHSLGYSFSIGEESNMTEEDKTAIALFQAIKNDDPNLLDYLITRFLKKKDTSNLPENSIA